jgi:DME family drug/metabolite transporter
MQHAPGAPSKADAANLTLGICLAAAAAIGLGCAIALSRLAFEGGTNALTVSSTRAVGVVLLTGMLILGTRRRLRIRHDLLPDVFGMGLLVAYMFFGNIAAVQYIPVGMAALLFFIYPPLVAVIMVVWFGGRSSWVKAFAIAGAFAGLALALGVLSSREGTQLRWEGVALSLSTGVATAVNAVWLSQRLRHIDPLVLTFHMGWIAAIALLTLLAFSGGPIAPQTASGWAGAISVVALQMCCVPMYFASIQHAGPETSTMVTNVQPVASILVAYLLYAELLSLSQLLGAALVIGGILLMQWEDWRARRKAG